MKIVTKPHLLAIPLAVVLAFSLISAATAQKDYRTIVVEEKSTSSETTVSNRAPSADEGLAPSSAPFSSNRETLPAGSAIVGTMNAGPDVVNYASSVAKKSADELVLNTTINKMEDDVTLSRLANKVYMENGGNSYDNVTIFWHVGENPEPAAPFARTDVQTHAPVFKVLRIQRN
ncbi:MAG: hypothetical protein DELT_01643 [Desulfovibrio sp.]